MAAPTIQAGNTKGASTSNETSTTVTVPSTAPSGDIVVIPIGSDASGDTFALTGFTELYADESYQSVASAGAFYKTSGGSESNYTVTSTVSERKVWQAFSVHGSSGINVSPASNNGSGATATFPAMTTTVDNCLGIRIVLTDQNATATTPFGAMTGWTKLDEHYGTSAGGCGVFYKTLATAGTEASGTCSLNVSEQWWTASFAFAPSNITFDDTITIARALAVAVTKQSNAQGSATLARTQAASVTKQSNALGSVSLARSEGVAITKQSNAQGVATLARTEGLTVTKQSNTQGSATLARAEGASVAAYKGSYGSVTLPRSDGVTVTQQGNDQGAATLARAEAIAVTKQSNTQGSTSLARSEGLTVTKNSIIYDSFALGRTEGASVAEIVGYYVSVSLSRSEGLTVAERVNAIALITLARSEGLTVTKQSNTQGSVGLGRSLSLVDEVRAETYGDASLAIHQSLVASAYGQVVAELALGRTLAINDPVGTRAFIASVSLEISKALSASAYKRSPVGVALGRSLSLAVAKQIAAVGYVTLPIALAITIDGEQIVVTIITPAFRTYNVVPEIRAFGIDHASDIDMAPDDRSFDV